MTAPFLSFPDADTHFFVDMPDGARLPVYGLAGPKAAPTMLFGHANGLAAGSYAPWLRRLSKKVNVFAFDARGHGGSVWPDGPLDEIFADDRMAEDLLHLTRAVAARVPDGRLSYVGHSLGAEAALRLLTGGGTPDWVTLAVFEPPIFPAPDAQAYPMARQRQRLLLDGAARRRPEWASPAALYDRLKGRGMFARFDDSMLRAHCQATLRPKPDGGYALCCPPAVEATIFRLHGLADTWTRLGRVAQPVDLVGGDPDVPENDWISTALPEMAAALPCCRFTIVPGTGHMLIFEEPENCAGLVLRSIAGG